ncbi:MAG: glucose-1-phosphate thymidylyltransferase RfbA [Opitutaceae bacterium]|nr:glucose-1-phosphate thymidylyltransferase RfbA [Opitutaceae bacterium]
MKKRKGIILAGGSGTRLYPTTLVTSKQLIPIYDKPMIFYPLSVLMLADIKDILIISTPTDLPAFQRLLGDGSNYGIKLSYEVQESPDGLAQAFLIGEDFINNSPVTLILGDNLFYGHDFEQTLKNASAKESGATVFGYHVSDPTSYGVVEFDSQGNAVSLEEKPTQPKSNFAVPGIYFYDQDVVSYAKKLTPSPRGELEITDLNRLYLEDKKLNVEIFGRGIAWLDTGTHDSLMEASQYVQVIENRQGLKIACLEEIAFHKDWITAAALQTQIEKFGKSSYGAYLSDILRESPQK